jgi:hypothetical protein
MSRVELERFVNDAESNGELRKLLRTCQTQPQLVLMARHLGYHITRMDLARAWQEHHSPHPQAGCERNPDPSPPITGMTERLRRPGG